MRGKLPAYGVMETNVDLTADAIRRNLLSRAEAYAKARNTSFSAIGKESISDDRFLARVAAGGNFTLATYQRVIDWLDAQEAMKPEQGAAA